RQRPLGVVPHVAQLKGIGEETVPQDAGGDRHQPGDGIDSVETAYDQAGIASLAAEVTGNDAKRRQHEGSHENQVTNIKDHGSPQQSKAKLVARPSGAIVEDRATTPAPSIV